MVIAEATAIKPAGRMGHTDLGIWSDAHVAPLARIAAFIVGQGAIPSIQLVHAGRKGAMQPLTQFNIAIQTQAPRWVADRALAAYQAAMAGGIAGGSWLWGGGRYSCCDCAVRTCHGRLRGGQPYLARCDR